MTGFEGVDGWNFVGRRPLGTLSSGRFGRPTHVASYAVGITDRL
jgi:hypothetical protein